MVVELQTGEAGDSGAFQRQGFQPYGVALRVLVLPGAQRELRLHSHALTSHCSKGKVKVTQCLVSIVVSKMFRNNYDNDAVTLYDQYDLTPQQLY